jgi:hypothetical protein
VRLQLALERQRGRLIEWIGEEGLRALVRQQGWPVADGLVHWQLSGREGTFLLEWDRGSESLPVLTAKLRRYVDYWRSRGHRQLLPGLRLRPRLLIVVATLQRADRLIDWLHSQTRHETGGTVMVGIAARVLDDPLAECWRRSDRGAISSFYAP